MDLHTSVRPGVDVHAAAASRQGRRLWPGRDDVRLPVELDHQRRRHTTHLAAAEDLIQVLVLAEGPMRVVRVSRRAGEPVVQVLDELGDEGIGVSYSGNPTQPQLLD